MRKRIGCQFPIRVRQGECDRTGLKLGVPPHVVEAVVNHASGLAKAGVAGVYNRALYLEERRKALLAWSDYIEQIAR